MSEETKDEGKTERCKNVVRRKEKFRERKDKENMKEKRTKER
jgi:hypothetical protein